jgi:hypothetical protein
MKPHLKKSDGFWIIYWRGKPVQNFKLFESAARYAKYNPRNVWDYL